MALGAWLLAAARGGLRIRAAGRRASSRTRRQDTGLDFVHVNGATGDLLLPEVIGSGGALFDYDNDGDLDLFAVQGSTLRPGASAKLRRRAAGCIATTSALNGDPRLRFTDVTERSGLASSGYGMGAATGDIDNDGWVDLYVTFLGSSRMFRNNGDGTFADVTAADRHRRSSLEHQRDVLRLRPRRLARSVRGHLRRFPRRHEARLLFRRIGPRLLQPGRSTPRCPTGSSTTRAMARSRTSRRAPASPRAAARGLGVLAADYNDDGWLDLYVANDGDANQLWINQRGSGTFTDEALLAGVAVNRMGQAQGSMGVDLGDIDGDGDEDLFVTNLDNEGNTLYLNVGKGLYRRPHRPRAVCSSLASPGFGTRFVDYDHDGWLDVFVANGAVRHLSRQVQAGDPYPLKQRNQVFRNDRARTIHGCDRAGRIGARSAQRRARRGRRRSRQRRRRRPGRLQQQRSGASADQRRRAAARSLARHSRRRHAVPARRAAGARRAGRRAAARWSGACRPTAATARQAIRAWCSGSTRTSPRRRFACTGVEATTRNFVDLPPIATGCSSAASRRGPCRTPWFDVVGCAVIARGAGRVLRRDTAAAQPPLLPVPLPRLDGLETAVADQIRDAQRQTLEIVAKTSASRDAADAYGSLARVYHAYEFFDSAEPAYVNAGASRAQATASGFICSGSLYKQTGRLEEAAAGACHGPPPAAGRSRGRDTPWRDLPEPESAARRPRAVSERRGRSFRPWRGAASAMSRCASAATPRRSSTTAPSSIACRRRPPFTTRWRWRIAAWAGSTRPGRISSVAGQRRVTPPILSSTACRRSCAASARG